MAQPTGLADEQLRALDRLKPGLGAGDFYLAGGSAVAFHLHHRRSADLDLFSAAPDTSLEAVRAVARAPRSDVEVIAGTDTALELRVGGVPVDVVRYPYPLLEPATAGPADFPVAGLLDLSTMKLAAIARRGIRRDFWDLHAITRAGIDLRTAGEAYVRRFGRSESDLYHVWRAITYFADADSDPVIPVGLSDQKWQEIRRSFRQLAPTLIEPDVSG